MLAGPAVIPAVRAFLFKRDRSGIYQPRRWAVEVLAALHAHDVLADYLLAPHNASDPVERAGDEAVINAAARALAEVRKEWVFRLLLNVARRHSSAGVVEALGAFDRHEALPHLIEALAEDDCRIIAENSLRRLGSAARPALLHTALARRSSPSNESETDLRQRRSAMGLLVEMRLSLAEWGEVRGLMWDRDARIALLACRICLHVAPAGEKRSAILRLEKLRQDVDWILAMEIDHCLQTYASEPDVTDGSELQ
jgi:hypothetical protein